MPERTHRPLAAPGWEAWLWRRLPCWSVLGLGLPWVVVAVRHWAARNGFLPAEPQVLLHGVFAAAGISLSLGLLLVALATGCWVVRVMKGPVREADSYALAPEAPLKPPGDLPFP